MKRNEVRAAAASRATEASKAAGQGAETFRREGNVSRNEGSRLILILAAEASAVLALSRLRLHGLQLRTHHEFEKGVPGGRKRQHH